jgi:chaperonin GroEL
MPFKEPFNQYYQKIIKVAVASIGLEALRADDIFGTNVIISDIWAQIWRARVVIADVTERNPNVNYELGLCHSLGVPTILITRTMDDVPFDYRHRRCITYDTNAVAWDQKLNDDLVKTINAVLGTAVGDGDLRWPYDTQKAAVASEFPLISTEKPRDLFVEGTKFVAGRVGKALGPSGAQFSLSIGNREPMPYKQGYSIVQGLRAMNVLEARGIAQMQLVAQEVYSLVGDGTKTTIILTQSLIQQGNELSQGQVIPSEILAGMEKGINCARDHIASLAQGISGKRVFDAAQTAAGTDPLVGEMISQAMESVGKDGVITVENSMSSETLLEVVEGMELDRGFLSEEFVNDAEANTVVLNDPYILVHERRISSMHDLLPLLEQMARASAPLLIIAEDVEGEALSTLVINKLRGTLAVAAIRAPGVGDRRKVILDDVAILTGARIIGSDAGFLLQNASISDLGTAKKVLINKDSTIIVEGGGKPDAIEARVKSIRIQIEESRVRHDRTQLQERLARLVGGLAVIKVGGLSEIEVLDKRYRYESAMHSARAAVEEGWVVGGAVSLLQASKLVKSLESEDDREMAGIIAVAQALEKPIYHLIENAGASPSQVLNALSEQKRVTFGYNVVTKRIEDLAETGVIDPAKVLRLALELALTHAKSVLQTQGWDIPTENRSAPFPFGDQS